MGKDISEKVKEKVINARNDLAEHMADKFQYPGSIKAESKGDPLESYHHLGIKDLQKIDTLLDKGVWPIILAGSHSQGYHYYCSNFCLEMYAIEGIKNPDTLLYLSEHGITHMHVSSTRLNLGLNDFSNMSGEEIEKEVKKFYGKGFKPETKIRKDYPGNLENGYLYKEFYDFYNSLGNLLRD